ncbi:uncharacterized protein isoform X2 [Salmo salar]|uniref:Uncharacterized protein isoform X2 n=2 Tax=Salmo salar TaxID=8030 RepID=A0ABM3DRC2_SALSA|nr:uncharacterized protein LOC106583583 isoform X2 [Salmo salar]
MEVTVFSIFLCFQLEYRHIFRIQCLQHLPFNLYGFYNVTHHETPCHTAILGDSNDKHPAFCSSLLSWGTLQNPFGSGRHRHTPRPFHHDPAGKSAEPILKKMNAAGPWGQSLYASISHQANIIQRRAQSRKRSLTRYITGHTLPHVQSDAQPSVFGLTFHKFAQVEAGTEFPHLTIFLLIHNIGPPGGTNLSKLAIRDSVSGIAPLQSGGMVVEKGFQTFIIELGLSMLRRILPHQWSGVKFGTCQPS